MDRDRSALLDEELAQLIERACDRYEVEKIIVFGSSATGQVGPWSDLDVVIVARTALPMNRRWADLATIASDRVSMDLLLLTPEEYAHRVANRRFFREEIEDKGRVVYDVA